MSFKTCFLVVSARIQIRERATETFEVLFCHFLHKSERPCPRGRARSWPEHPATYETPWGRPTGFAIPPTKRTGTD